MCPGQGRLIGRQLVGAETSPSANVTISVETQQMDK